MSIPVVMPKIGLTMTEGKILEWKKREGDWVEKGEIIFVFETEKVTFDVEAQEAGFLAKILAREEEVVPVGAVVALLAKEEGEQISLPEDKAGGTPGGGEEKIVQVSAPRADTAGKADRIRATPMARRLARERGVDIKTLVGSGVGGRIRMKDVESAPDTEPDKPVPPAVQGGRLVKPSGMRRIIAQKMLASKVETAQTYMTVTVDATNIVKSREQLIGLVEKRAGVRLTITDILMKITATAIAFHPIMNTKWTSEGIVWFDSIHMGMAMALEEGLIVPVIWDIAPKSTSEIAKARAALVEKGKKGQLTPDEMKGSTFTLSSLGMFGIEEFTANINLPESAILAVGAILDKPVVIHQQIVIRPTMKLTLSYDHRVIDGAKAAEFMKTLKEMMEDPILVLA